MFCSLIKFLRFVFEDHEALIEYLSGLARWYYTDCSLRQSSFESN